MATVLPAQAAFNAKLNRSRPTQKERKLIRQQQQQTSLADADAAAVEQDDVFEAAVERSDAVPQKGGLDWLSLTDQSPHTCPAVFTPDAAHCFIASGAAVRIYSVRTTELLSTLSIPPSSTHGTENGLLSRSTITAVLLSPSNPRQLVVTSTDGRVRVWDYVEGKLLRTLEMGAPVLHAAANDKLPDQLFVALAAPEEAQEGVAASTSLSSKGKAKAALAAPVEQEQVPLAGVYVVSLRAARGTAVGGATASSAAANTPASPSTPVPPARRVRLAVPRQVRALALSPSGAILASLTPTRVHLCQTAQLNKGFVKSVDAPIDGERFSTVAFHPTDNVFATGNEKGQIRVWYNVLPRPPTDEGGEAREAQMDLANGEASTEPSSSVLHWHAHAVSSLAFTPNGAYLLSGGREAVLVLWQLHSGHQEYVPRLGAEIETLTVLESNASEGGEQQVAVRLRDGSTVFVGSQRLKIVKTIAGLKSDLSVARSSSSPVFASRTDLAVPLAIDPATSSLVLPSGHPSSLQFYSPSSDAQLLELEISPSNRVASANGTVEPTRVERVAFSTPASAGGKGEYWMATIDSWSREGYASVRQLKFWRKREGQPGFVLSTRVDRPHEAPITSIAFSPSSTSPLLLTTSTDGRIKVWGPSSVSEGAWQCRASLSYRSSAPVASAWSHDGSLFAIAHTKRTVTLWSVANAGQLVHAFPATAIGRPKSICFADKEGTKILCAGSSGAVCWDLLTLEETFSSSIEFAALVPKPQTGTLIGIEDVAPSSVGAGQPAALLYVFDPSSSSPPRSRKTKTRPLPHPVRQALWLPSLVAGVDDVSLAVTSADATDSVALVGSAARSSSAAGAGAATRLPLATEGTTRLFDEIFGETDLSASKREARTAAREARPAPAGDKKHLRGGILGTADGEGTPAHTLPPVRMLWREVFRDAFAVRRAESEVVLPPSQVATAETDQHERVEEEQAVQPEWHVGDTEAVRRIFAARLGM